MTAEQRKEIRKTGVKSAKVKVNRSGKKVLHRDFQASWHRVRDQVDQTQLGNILELQERDLNMPTYVSVRFYLT